MFRSACLTLILLLADPVWADPRRARVPGSEIVFEIRDGNLVLSKGNVRAPLSVEAAHPEMHPDLPVDVRVEAAGSAVTVTVLTNCQGRKKLTLSRDALEARLESAAAAALSVRKQWEAAAAGFARAVKLDPDLGEAATSLAAAEARAGRQREAAAALGAASARDPIGVVWRVAVDPALTDAGRAPEIQALSARVPGGATLRSLRKVHAAHAAERKLVAWDWALGNSMREDGGGRPSELRIADATTGKLLARIPYRARDRAAVDRTLATLGFETDSVRSHDLERVGDLPDTPVLKGTVPASGVRVVVANARARLVDRGRVLGEAKISGNPLVGGWVAKVPGGVLVAATVSVGDGCGAWDYDDVVWIPVPR